MPPTEALIKFTIHHFSFNKIQFIHPKKKSYSIYFPPRFNLKRRNFMDGMIKGGERVRDVVRSFDSRERNTRKFFDFTILAVINS